MPEVSSSVISVSGKTGIVNLNKNDVGLNNVDNTSDISKNVLSATKLTTPITINNVSFNGLNDITIYDSTKEPIIDSSNVNNYYRGDKTWQPLNKNSVGLNNVENTALSTWNGSSNINQVGTI